MGKVQESENESSRQNDSTFVSYVGPADHELDHRGDGTIENDAAAFTDSQSVGEEGFVVKTTTVRSKSDSWIDVGFEQPFDTLATTDPWWYDHAWFRADGVLGNRWSISPHDGVAEFRSRIPPGESITTQVVVEDSPYTLKPIDGARAGTTDAPEKGRSELVEQLRVRRRGIECWRGTRPTDDGSHVVELAIESVADEPVFFSLASRHAPSLDLEEQFVVDDDGYVDGWGIFPEDSRVFFEWTLDPGDTLTTAYSIDDPVRPPGRLSVPNEVIDPYRNESGDDSDVRQRATYSATRENVAIEKTVFEPVEDGVDRYGVFFDITSNRESEALLTLTEDFSDCGTDWPDRISFPDGQVGWTVADSKVTFEDTVDPGESVRLSYRLDEPTYDPSPPKLIYVRDPEDGL